MRILPYKLPDREAVIAFWIECGLTRPWNNPERDIERKLTEQPELFLVAKEESEVVATAMVGFDGNRGWLHYLGVRPSKQRLSLGRQMMEEAERLLKEHGCPKLNLQIRSTNTAAIAFYDRLGYAVEDMVIMGKRLIPD